jgi:2'-5' RNA ligase
MRLFIAFPVSKEIKNKIAKLQKDLKSKVVDEKISWVNPDNIHLTIKFLGEVDPEKVEVIGKIMAKSINRVGVFEMNIENGGVFPSKNKPRVMWVGCNDPTENISKIKKSMDNALKKLGFKKEKKKFNAHLTIGRIRSMKKISNCVDALLSNEILFGKMKMQKIQLISSRLSPQGSEYEVIKEIKL